MTLRNNLFYIVLILTFISCATTNTLISGQFSKKETYKINSYYGCCGCAAKYFTISDGKRELSQIIYWYTCSNRGRPTKFIFNYENNGKLINCNKYIATLQDDYELKITEQEMQIFSRINTDSVMKGENAVINYLEIKGFRKPTEKEITHLFPFVRKGYELPVQ